MIQWLKNLFKDTRRKSNTEQLIESDPELYGMAHTENGYVLSINKEVARERYGELWKHLKEKK